ncbi:MULTISPECIES: TerC/Alx family metal homeostasis membrane protein [Cobetia]|uniref:TerC/Alx family metal homeostasis membrane protein n=1 Tax=Cobetia crustatorum TaxID=553385 RepID=A0A558HLH3_9GAMM|nr:MULTISPECIES: TerC/Alx family metal homeostasis membrane protein [Cobetia]TVU69994.1 TerC/Alx family metal homeostasis membrane protein [Cobetia crustatorum]
MDFGFPIEAVTVLVVVVIASVWLDLFAHRNAEEVTFKNALGWSVFWVALAMAFYGYLHIRYSEESASLFLSGYVLEKALSIDNMMVFVAIFASFNIKGILQHRILYYGIAGALIFRAIFVAAGTALFGMSQWVELLFAAIVLWTGIKMFGGSGDEETSEDYSEHWSVRLTQKFMPVFPRMAGKRFVLSGKEAEAIAEREGFTLPQRARFYATPVLLCLICIEISDIIFSFDSVPAIVAITQEPFLVYASVIFAILGLRNLYFMLAAAAKLLVHLEKAVALVLVFIAIKLGTSALDIYHIDHQVSLFVVLGLILGGVLASLVFPGKETPHTDNQS